MEEKGLLERAVAGDSCALRSLLERHGPALMRRIVIPRACRGTLSVDDVMQETYIDAMRDIGRFRPRDEGSFLAWLRVLSHNNFISAIRMLRAERRGGAWRRIEPTSGPIPSVFGRALAVSVTASRQFYARERVALVRSAIAELPGDYSTVLRMYDLEARPMEDVARKIGKTRGAAYMLRARACRKLKELLGTPSMFLT